jgi:hypothetical protein
MWSSYCLVLVSNPLEFIFSCIWFMQELWSHRNSRC